MTEITLGQIGLAITFLAGLIGGISVLHGQLKKWIAGSLQDQLDSINQKMDRLSKKIDDVDMETCKNFLVARLSEVGKDIPMDEIERERFWEEYEHYKSKGGNSYVERKVEELKSLNKL